MTDIADKPWYRHFWVWVVLAPLIAAVIASFITLWLAGAPPPLVDEAPGAAAEWREPAETTDKR